MNRATSRDSLMDPEDSHAKLRAENERRRIQGDCFWGGRDISGKEVYIEGAVYHFIGKIRSIGYNVIWLDDAHKVFNNDKDTINEKMYAGEISIPVPTVMMLALKGELAWYK